VALLALLLVGINASRSLMTAQALASQRLQARQLLFDAKDLVAAQYDAASAERGFLLTGD
jgi:CHASE3 domain sensor protein